MLVNVPELITAYYTDVPDPIVPALLAAEITARMGRDSGETTTNLRANLVSLPMTALKHQPLRSKETVGGTLTPAG